MTTVKEAASSAIAFIADLFPDARDIRLEQVERGAPYWRVVVSFKGSEAGQIFVAIGQVARLFKEVDIDRETGEPMNLRIWKA